MRVVGGKSRGPHSIINLREARERYIVLSSSNCHSPWLIGKYQVLVAQTCITLTFAFVQLFSPMNYLFIDSLSVTDFFTEPPGVHLRHTSSTQPPMWLSS